MVRHVYKVNDDRREYIISQYRVETLQPRNWSNCKIRVLYEYKDIDKIIEVISEYKQIPQDVIDDIREGLRQSNRKNRAKRRKK